MKNRVLFFLYWQKKLLRVFLVFSCLLVTVFAMPQDKKQQGRYISGCVTDAGDGNPIPGVSVFIANTTMGVLTDSTGNYRLKIPGTGSYRLTVSHVGYQPVFKDIDPGNTTVTLDVSLISYELEEVKVSAKVRFRRLDIDLFWKTILGKSPSRRTIYPINPEAVYYYYNPKTGILKVTCRQPLEIINKETGYHIKLVLHHFTHNYNTDDSLWQWEYMFTELTPENDKQKTTWEKNRKRVYRFSLTNFIKSLYHNSLMEKGYLLTYPTKKTIPDVLPKEAYQKPDTFLTATSGGESKAFYIPSDLEGLVLVCFGRPITSSELNLVTFAQMGKTSGSRIGSFQNRLQTPNDSVYIFPDGTFSNLLKLSSWSSSNSILGLNMTLPVEYICDVDYNVPETDSFFEDELSNRFYQQLSLFPQEKIYVHTDKPCYIAGERIWFRAYLADAATHVPNPASHYVYVELFNPLNSIVSRVKIRQEEETYHGHLPIPDDVPEGDYTLRAYTSFMRSLDEDYFFTKNIHIGHSQAHTVHANTSGRKNDIIVPTPGDDFDVTFYPEGGSLMMGTTCKTAFKAMKSNGQAIPVSGVIYDQYRTKIKDIRSDYLGMGSFLFLAEKEKTYYAVLENEQGQSKRFELPPALEQGYALAVSNQMAGEIYVTILQPAESVQTDELYLLAHTRGMVQFVVPWDHKKNRAVFPRNQLPSGVLHLILFDANRYPVSERLVFINNQDQAIVSYQPDKEMYAPRSLVNNRVTVTDNEGQPLTGSFSVAVTSDREVTPDSTSNIHTLLLLTSDLRGHIENPGFYFRDVSSSSYKYKLDLLMLTQGWRRYNITEIAQGRFVQPAWPVEAGQEISGVVKNVLSGKPVQDIEVHVASSNKTYFDKTKTDVNGRFYFSGDEFTDSIGFIVCAVPQKNMTRLALAIDGGTFPERTLSAVVPTEIDRMQFAKEATVTDEQKPLRKSIWYDSPDDSFTEEDIIKIPATDIFDLITQIGSRTPQEKTDNPLIMIDDVPVAYEYINMFNINEIKQIDILNFSENTAFGSKDGVISIFTKKPEVSKITPPSHIKTFFPLSYQLPVQFYAPIYNTPEKRTAPAPDLRTTIHWQPVVQTDSLGVASFEFYTGDEPPPYTVIIEGLTHDGRIIRQEGKIN